MVKGSSDRKRGKPLGYTFRLAARFFFMHHPTDRIAHTTAFVKQLWSTGWNEK